MVDPASAAAAAAAASAVGDGSSGVDVNTRVAVSGDDGVVACCLGTSMGDGPECLYVGGYGVALELIVVAGEREGVVGADDVGVRVVDTTLVDDPIGDVIGGVGGGVLRGKLYDLSGSAILLCKALATNLALATLSLSVLFAHSSRKLAY